MINGLLYDHDLSKLTVQSGFILASLLITSNLFVLYFRTENSPKFLHALRRKGITGLAWSMIHLPFSISVVIVGSCLAGMISKLETVDFVLKAAGQTNQAEHLTHEFQTVFGTAFAFIHWCLAIWSVVHLEEDPSAPMALNIPSRLRSIGRAIIGLAFLLVGLLANLEAYQWLIICCLVTTIEVYVEEYGRIRVKLAKEKSRSQLS